MMEEIVAAIQAIEKNYDMHCRAARALAEEYFEARNVCADLLRQVGLN
jgi:hypothetical protein